MRSSVKGNLAMIVSKTFSGFNQNALKYLVPNWMSPLSGVALRLMFGAVAFWGISTFAHQPKVEATVRQKATLLIIGAVFMFGYMYGLLGGLKYTTPITSSIFISLQPAIVFVISAIFLKDKVTAKKIIGIVIGIAGALVIILTQRVSTVATDPMLGAGLCLFSALTYSIYLILSKVYIRKLDNITVSKWTFTGGAVVALIVALFAGWDAPVLEHFKSTAMFSLLYVLIFPTTISYFLLDIGLRNLSATTVALYGNLILIVSTIASYILGQDIFSWWQILAICLMLLSVYLVEVAESKTQPGQQQ